MAETKKLFDCRIEEMPTLAKFIYDALARDLAEIEAEYPDFNDAYLSNFDDRRSDVIDLVNPVHFTNALKIITARMGETGKAMRPYLDKLEGYVKLAAKPGSTPALTVDVKDFGISPVREAISDGDVEELDLAFRTMKKNITDNYEALFAKGYNDSKRDELYALADAVNSDNAAQNLEVDKRDAKVEENLTPLNELWKIMTEVCDFGKRVYKSTNPAKLDDYTMSSLINRVRNEDPKARYRTIRFDADETRTLKNVIDDTKAQNTGDTNLEWSPGTALADPATPWEAGTEITITTVDGKVTIHNLSDEAEGKCRYKALGET